MAEADPPLLITRWARRSDRAPPAFAAGYARLDERGFPDLIAEAVHFARHVRYFNVDDVEDGDWEALLAADPAVFLAVMAAFDIGERAWLIRRLLRRLRGDDDFEAREQALWSAARLVVDLGLEIDRWIGPAERLHGHPGGYGAGEMVVGAVDDLLGPRLRRLVALLRAVERSGREETALLVVVDRFHGRWRIDSAEEVEIGWESDAVWLDSVADAVAEEVDAFVAAAESLVARSRGALEESLAHERHAPHVALLLAFLKLFEHEQERLNDVLPRIACFYHERMVGASPRPARPDRSFVAFGLQPNAAPGLCVARGQVLEAGTGPDGKPVRFATDEVVQVGGARPTELRLWQVDRETGRVGVSSTPLAETGEVAESFAAAASRPLPPAQIGLVIAGPALRAESGSRSFTIVLDLAGLDLPADADAADFSRLLQSGIRLSVLTAQSWVEVDAVHTSGSTIDGSNGRAVFDFTLTPDAPALLPDAPAVRILLVQQPVEPTTMSVLKDARVVGVTLDLAVSGLSGLSLSTSAGPAASPVGLPPFGTPPACGGWLGVDHPVLARGLRSVALALRWAELPPNPDGFLGYYREYAVDMDRRVHGDGDPLFDNRVFQVRMEAPLGAAADLPLFQPGPGDAALDPVSRFRLERPYNGVPTATASSGVRLTLTAPEHAFGDHLFPLNVAFATDLAANRAERTRRRDSLGGKFLALLVKLAKAPVTLVKATARLLARVWALFFLTPEAFESEPQPPVRGAPEATGLAALMPNPPWRPTLAGLSLDYEARFELKAGEPSDGQIHLLHWLPLDEPVSVPWEDGAPLLPELPARTAFELAFGGGPAGEGLSLLFILSAQGAGAGVEWLVHEEGRWGPAPFVSDGTGGLARTGILRLGAVPARLRALTTGPLTPVSAIIADAVGVTRILRGADDPVAPVPAGTIIRVPGVKGLGTVRQPLGSFGGVPAEAAGDMAARSAERLRHRNRAVQSGDQERLLLDRFPDIDRVRILPARGRDGTPQGGGVLAVVVPGPGGLMPPDPLRPAATAELLDRVKVELAGRASHFARIEAVSPAYVAVDVRAEIALAGDATKAQLEADIRAFLSPWAEEGLELEDNASARDVAAALVRFIRSRPYVDAVADLHAELSEVPGAQPWRVPTAGEIVVDVLELESFVE